MENNKQVHAILGYAFSQCGKMFFRGGKMKIIKFITSINNNFNAFFHLEKKPLSLLKFKQSGF